LYLKVLTSKRALTIAIACFVGTAFLLWLPFCNGLVTFTRPFAMATSSYSLLFVWRTLVVHWLPSYSLLAERLWSVFIGGCFLLYYVVLLWKVRCFQEMLYASAVLLFFMVTVVLPAQATWYCSWILPFAILSTDKKLIVVSAAYSFTSLFGLVIYYYTHSYAPYPQVLGTLLEIVPPLALALGMRIWVMPKVNA